MKHYKYIGKDPSLRGHTALGQEIDIGFVVQVDCLRHEWSIGWHETNPADWEELTDE